GGAVAVKAAVEDDADGAEEDGLDGDGGDVDGMMLVRSRGDDDDEDEDGEEAERDLEEELEIKAYLEIKNAERKKEKEERKRAKAAGKAAKDGGDDEDEEDEDDEEEGDDEEEEITGVSKIYKNDKAGLVNALERIALDTPDDPLPWIEYQAITSSAPLDLAPEDVDDDKKRELAFYKQALEAAVKGEEKLKKLKVPVRRPDDYYAEMVKSDEQMMRVRQKLIDEANSIQAAEKARKMREAKKFGKKVQQEKLAERERSKRDEVEKVKLLRKKSKSLANAESGAGDDDDFGITVEKGDGKGDRVPDGKTRKDRAAAAKKRAGKDAKFGFGGQKKRAKANTRDSVNDFKGFDQKKMKGKGGGGGGGKGGPKGGAGKMGPKKGGGVKKRPGKAMRQKGGK
ncbi:rRNA-processing protein and EBNA1-binding protein ebp2, partial [Irineochytrium annulatum]